jgi:iron complex outermembrane receptor protein
LLGGEVGATLAGSRGELQAVAFHHRIEDGIVRLTIETEEGGKRQRVNQDRIRATGLELLFRGSLGLLDYSGDLTVQRVRLLNEDGSQARAEYEPDLMGKLNLGGRLPAELMWTVGARFVGEMFCTTQSSEQGARLDANGTLDAGLRRAFPFASAGMLSTLDVLAAIDNVTDAAFYDQCGLPQPGRRFRIQFRLF